MKKGKAIISIIAAAVLTLAFSINVFAGSEYIHDPMDNPKAAADIVENPDAVYGYSPSPDSVRLKEFVDYDWSDPEGVNQMREQRIAYHESLEELYDMISAMRAEGKTTEEIARAVSTRRNELRLENAKDDPEELEKVKKSNLDTYGNENGGTPDYFYEKYGSWETVIEKALSTNAGADACLGLYDEYYDTYIIDTYVVKEGDCLSLIAKKMLDDETLWPWIYSLNTDQIGNPDLVYKGQILRLTPSA